MNAFWNTMAVATGAGLMTALVGVGVLVAWMGLGRWGRRGLLGGALVTMAMPPFLVANCWLEWSAGWRLKWGAEHSATAMLPWTAFVLASLTWPIPALLAMGESGRLGRAVFDAVPGLRGADAFRYLLWPMVRGPIALGASIVWSVDITRCPVSAAVMVALIVSRSLISPTSMTSGSCRKT